MTKPGNLLLTVVVLSFTTGCAGLSVEQQTDREFRNLEYAERFRADSRRCFANGGRIVVDALGELGRDGVPKHRARYVCAT